MEGCIRICWLDLNSSYSHSSLALPAIEAQAERLWNSEKYSLRWLPVQATLKSKPDQVVEELILTRAEVVCATAWLFNASLLLDIISRFKALKPNVKVILGGPEFLGDNMTFLQQHPQVDAVFRGEGEEGFYQWLSCFAAGQSVRVPGVCCRNADGYYDGGMAKVTDFESLVPPYQSQFFPWDKPFVQLETTRGCFNTCRFCVSGTDKPVRMLGIDRIRQSIREFRLRGIRNVRVLDRTFNGNEKRALEMLDVFESEGEGMCFHLEVHPAFLTEDMKIRLMHMPSGRLHLEAGLQSLQQEVILLSGRKGDTKAALEGLHFLSESNLFETHTDLIAGLPGYSYAQTVQDVVSLIKMNVAEVQLESLKLLPGTPFREHAAEYGLTFAPNPPYEVLASDVLTLSELNKLMRLSVLLDQFYNALPWHDAFRELCLQDVQFPVAFIEFLGEKLESTLLSQERKGELLYDFVCDHLPEQKSYVSAQWMRNHLSLKRRPAEGVMKWHGTDPNFYYYAIPDDFRNVRYVFAMPKLQRGKASIRMYSEPLS